MALDVMVRLSELRRKHKNRKSKTQNGFVRIERPGCRELTAKMQAQEFTVIPARIYAYLKTRIKCNIINKGDAVNADAADDDLVWRTIKGTHVVIRKSTGEIVYGPPKLRGITVRPSVINQRDPVLTPEDELRLKIKYGIVKVKLDRRKASKHIAGTTAYNNEIAKGHHPSVLTIDDQTQREFIREALKKGKVIKRRDGSIRVEYAWPNGIIGVSCNASGTKWKETCVGELHLSKSGIHIVPVKEAENRNGR